MDHGTNLRHVKPVRAILCIVYFPVCMRGFLHILHIYTCTYTGIWPPGNTSCIFLTWYQSYSFFFPHAQLILRSNLTGTAAIVFRPLSPSSSSAATLRTSSVASIYSGLSSCSLRLPISAAPGHFRTADFVDPVTCCRSFPPFVACSSRPPSAACSSRPLTSSPAGRRPLSSRPSSSVLSSRSSPAVCSSFWIDLLLVLAFPCSSAWSQ
jgi:hypothetical protein